jgi:hypothetical protein
MNSLRQLFELKRIIDNFGNKTSKSLFSPTSKNNQLSQLARKIAAPGKPNEREWAMEICQTNPSDQTYIRIRSQLKRRLLGSLFHLEIRTGSEFRKALYRSAKDVFCIRMLLVFGARGFAIWLIPLALERARNYELTQDQIELLQLLRQDATIKGLRKQFAQYVEELDEALILRSAEIKVQGLDDEINVELVGKAYISKKATALIKSARPEAAAIFAQHPTFNIGLSYYRIASLAAESGDDSRLCFDLCTQAETFLARFPHLNTPLYIGQFAIKRLSSAIAIQDFASARNAVEVCEQCFPETTNNWFIWKESELHLLLHSNAWAEAGALHRQITTHERFGMQPEQVQQMWALLGHYTSFATWAQERSTSEAEAKHFNIVLDEVTIYKRDKAGYNAALYILQYLILASRADFDGLIKKSEAIVKYMDRYMRGRHETQLFGFLKTLVLLNKYDYDLDRTRKRARRYIEQFLHIGRENVDEAQTLRYDLMWQWICQWMGTKMGAKPLK